MRNNTNNIQSSITSNLVVSDAPAGPSTSDRLHRAALVLRPFKWVFALIAVGFLAFAGWDSRSVLAGLISNAEPRKITIALGLGICAHLLAPVCSIAAIRFAGGQLSYRYALLVHLRNLPGRYVPGGVWHTLGRAHDFLADGMKQSHITAMIALESAMPVGVGLTTSSVLLILLRDPSRDMLFIPAAGLVGGIAILLAMPLIISKLTRRPLSKFDYMQYLSMIFVYLFAWVLLAGTFTAYLSSFHASVSAPSLVASGATYVFSWAVGFIAVFAPQGIGVFELTAAYFLRNGMDIGAIAALVAGYRIIPVLSDTVSWASFLVYRGLGKGESR